MNTPNKIIGACDKPVVRPKDPRFSSGPCKKHPGWSLNKLSTKTLCRSHRAAEPKSRLQDAIDKSSELLALPKDWQMAIVPASDTGAFELAMWNMLGARPVDVFAWESFSNDWLVDIQQQLKLQDINCYTAEYGELPDLNQAKPEHDAVFVYNGTTSGVRVPNMDWIADDREGLVFCDATSAAFAMPIDFNKIDVLSWSWQKVLGGEAGFGMLALSPSAIKRLETYVPSRPLPKIFRLLKKGKINRAVFAGATINTPSMLAVEDLHSALAWAESIGGSKALLKRSQDNFSTVNEWIEKTDWVDYLARRVETRSNTSICLKITTDTFLALNKEEQAQAIKSMCAWLEEEGVAYDIEAYRDAPPGFRLWAGATVEADDLKYLLPWLDWAYYTWEQKHIKEVQA